MPHDSQKPIRAIVARFFYSFSHGAMEEVLKKRPFEYCAILSSGSDPHFYDAIVTEKQDWFNSSEVRGCIYPETDWASLTPLDANLIESMRDCESVFMEMVSRQEWTYVIPYATRKRWYLKHLQYWNDYIEKHRINLFLSAWLPHEIPDIVIYYLCKKKNIPIVYFHMSTEYDTQFLEHDIEESASQIGKRFEELVQEAGGVPDVKDIVLTKEGEERFSALTAPKGQKPALQSITYPTYRHRLAELLKQNLLSAIGHAFGYLTPKGIARAAGAFKRWRIIRARNAFYDKHAVHPDLSAKFIYVALHFQPEASTVPMAGVFADQLLIAQMLQAVVPKDVLIYVKEHPRESSWLMRSVEYYATLLALPNARLIARDVDTFLLREHCLAVGTATGSVGFEALFRGKPVLMFGHRFYQYARGVYRIKTKDDLQRAVDAVLEGDHPSLAEGKLYLKAMQDTRIHGCLNPWDYKVTRLPEEAHIRANSEAILKELETLLS